MMMYDPMGVEIYIETFVDGSAADVGVPLIATLSLEKLTPSPTRNFVAREKPVRALPIETRRQVYKNWFPGKTDSL